MIFTSSRSQVAETLAAIRAEYEVGKCALHGYAEVASHAVQNARMQRVADRFQDLAKVAGGGDNAMALMVGALEDGGCHAS